MVVKQLIEPDLVRRVDALLAAGEISPAEHDQACAIARDSEQVSRTGNSPIARAGLGTDREPAAAGGPSDAQIDAQARLRRLRAKLGETDFQTVIWVAAHDLPWARLSWKLGVSDKTARLRAIAAIRRLSG
jgi:hypothetical protein